MVDDVERSTLRKWVVLLILVGIASGSMAFGKRFGLHSIGTILALLVTGGLTATQASRIEKNLPTPGRELRSV